MHNKDDDYWIAEESHKQRGGQQSSHYKKYRLYIHMQRDYAR